MRLGIDAREIENGVSTGRGRMLYNFLHYLSEGHYNDQLVVFSSKPLPFSFGHKIENQVMFEDSRIFWDQVKLPLVLKKQLIEVFYSPYYKLPLWSSVKSVCTVLDLMYMKYPLYRGRLGLGATVHYRIFGKQFLHKAKRILTCSQYTKNDIVEFYGTDRRKIVVIPLSVSSSFRPETDTQKMSQMRAAFGIRGKYVLYVGNFKPHKNVPALLKAFRATAGYENLQLVLAGPKTTGYAQLVRQAKELGIDQQLVFTGIITEEENLRSLYSGAEVFVMPSLYEGFGLPSVEAMACGTPVVCSNATSLPEVVSDAALLVDASRPDEIARAVTSVLGDQRLRTDLVRRGVLRAVEFNEHTVSRRMFDFFKDMVS